jgi:hypothetical protein
VKRPLLGREEHTSIRGCQRGHLPTGYWEILDWRPANTSSLLSVRFPVCQLLLSPLSIYRDKLPEPCFVSDSEATPASWAIRGEDESR